ncbi:MAG: fibronectin type III domain-containing protein [Acutalibacteraceae bacterium]
MKTTIKNFAAVILCLSIVLSTGVFAFAIGTVSKPKASATYNSITLSWQGVSGADGYEVYVASGNSWKKLAATSSRTYTHKNLKIDTTYKYRVRAYDKGIFKTTYGAFSSTASAKTALNAVKNFKVSAATETGFTLGWSKVAGATGYQVFRYTGGKWVYTYKTTANSKTVTGAKLGATYQYRVRAYRTENGKNYYGPVSSTLKAQCALTPVSGVKASVTATAATLAWKAVSSASGYQVYLKNGSKWVKQANVTSAKYTIKGLKVATKYQVRLRTYKKVGSGYVFSAWTDFAFTTAKSTNALPGSMAEICAAYNKAVNDAKKMKNGTVHKTDTLDLVCTDCSVSMLQGTVDKLLQSFLTPTDKTITVKNGVARDQDGNVTDLNSWITPSGREAALKASYVASASAKATSDGYKMAIRLKTEVSTFDGTNTVIPVGHQSCLDPLNLAALELPVNAQITAASMTYPGATLVAYVNRSGKLTKLAVKLPIEGTGTGKLGASLSLSIKGEMNESYDFTY